MMFAADRQLRNCRDVSYRVDDSPIPLSPSSSVVLHCLRKELKMIHQEDGIFSCSVSAGGLDKRSILRGRHRRHDHHHRRRRVCASKERGISSPMRFNTASVPPPRSTQSPPPTLPTEENFVGDLILPPATANRPLLSRASRENQQDSAVYLLPPVHRVIFAFLISLDLYS